MKKRSRATWLPVIIMTAMSLDPGGLRALPLPARSPQTNHPDASKPADDDVAKVEPLDFTEQVVKDVLGKLQRAVEGRRLSQVLEVFDSESKDNYADLQGQLKALFQKYDTIQIRYHVLQVTSDKSLGFVIADVDIDATASDDSQLPLRRSTQVRLQTRLGPDGWKIVGFKPADLFAE